MNQISNQLKNKQNFRQIIRESFLSLVLFLSLFCFLTCPAKASAETVFVTNGSAQIGNFPTAPYIANTSWRINTSTLNSAAISSISAAFSGPSSSTLTDATGWTSLVSANVDDSYIQVPFGFNNSFNNTNYSSVFVGSNTYLTFGSGSGTLSTSISSPPYPAVHMCAADNSYQKVLYKLDDANTMRVRYEGANTTYGTVGSPNIVYEAVFYKDQPYFDLYMGVNARCQIPTNPTVSLTSASPNPISANGTIAVTATFSQAVSDFVLGDITVTNGTAGTFSGSGTTYTFIVTPASDGLVNINIASGVATSNTTSLTNLAATQLSRTYDSNPPVNLTYSANPIKVGTQIITATYSEVVVGTPAISINQQGSTDITSVPMSGSGTTWTYNYNINAANGTTYIDGIASVSLSAITSTVTGKTFRAPTNNTFTIDTTAPTVSLSSAAAATVNAPFSVTATFNEVTTNFVLGDITVTNGTASNFSGSGTTYTFTVSPTVDGLVSVNVGAGVATDAALNGNTAAPTLTRTYSGPPSVVLSSSAAASLNTSFTVTATFSKSVTNFVLGDVIVTNGTASGFSGSGTAYTFTVTPTTDGIVTVDVGAGVAIDTDGNGNLSATGDTTPSTPSIGSNLQGGKVAYILQAGDPGYIADGKVRGFIAATTDQSAGIRWYNGSNTVTGATETALGAGLSNTNKIITSQGATATSYAAGLARAHNGGGYTDWYLPSANELNKLFLSQTAIGGFNSSGWYSSSSEISNSFINTVYFGNGSYYYYNKSSAYPVRAVRSFSVGLTRTYDTIGPSVYLTSNAASSINVPFTVTATFTKSTSNFTVGDITVTNGTASNFSGSGTTYTFTVNPTSSGTVAVDVLANVATDSLGNGNISTAGATTYSLRDTGPAGGHVFYSTNGGLQGLEAAPLSTEWVGKLWGCYGTTIGANGTAVGTGNQNTTTIVTGCTVQGIAARLAYDLTSGGKDDWFLPSKDELNLMYTELKVSGGGGFSNTKYWSSTENNWPYAMSQDFTNGTQNTSDNKNSAAYYVRAVRVFIVATSLTRTYTSSAPTNQDSVFPTSISKTGGASVSVTSSGDATNNIWFAPSGTTVFSAGGTMTTAGGTATSILAPATAGVYKLFVVNSGGVSSAASTANLTVDNTAPTVTLTSVAAATVNAPFSVTATFSEVTTNFVLGDITVTNGTASSFSGSGTTYTFTVTPSTSGLVSINVNANVATDAAGNGNVAATSLTRTYDNTAPTIGTLSPVDNATGVGINDNLVITYSEAVNIGTGNIIIKKTSDNTTFETIAITDAKVTGTGTNTITINPSGTLIAGVEYYVLIDGTAIDDLVGNSFLGVSSTTAWSFTTASSSNSELRSPQIAVDMAGIGSLSWTNPDNVKVSDTSFSTSSGVNVTTHYLASSNFGFTIPSGSTINGILVEIQKNSSLNNMGNFVIDSTLKIIKADGSYGTTNKADTVTDWPFTQTYTSYGGATDLWGESWTAENINDVDFGVGLSAYINREAFLPIASVNHVRITVYYTEPITLSLSQSGYKFFDNINSTNVSGALSSLNNSGDLEHSGDNFRLRLLIKNSGANLSQNGQTFKLQFAEKVGQCDIGFVGEVYSDVTNNTSIAYYNNFHPLDKDVVTTNNNDPTDGVNIIINQSYVESNNFSNSISAIDVNQNGLWDFSLYDKDNSDYRSYCLRVVKADGNILDNYSFIPEIMTAIYRSRGGGGVHHIEAVVTPDPGQGGGTGHGGGTGGFTACSDGIDNDADTFIDSADANCHVGGNINNPYVPTNDSEINSPGSSNGGGTCINGATNPPQCTAGIGDLGYLFKINSIFDLIKFQNLKNNFYIAFYNIF